MNKIQHIDLRHLHYFLAAAEHGSFRRAGAIIGVSESEISRRVRSLEGHLEKILFQRSNSGVSLTVAGRCFLCLARKIVRDLGNGIRDVAVIGLSTTGWIRVGIVAPLVSEFMIGMLREFEKSNEGIELQFIEGTTQEHIRAIKNLDIDLALVALSDTGEGLDNTPLWTEGLFIALPQTHRLASLGELEWSNCIGQSFILSDDDSEAAMRANLVKHFTVENRPSNLSIHRVRSSNLPTLVAMGRGLAVVNEATSTMRFPGVVFRPIRDEKSRSVQYGQLITRIPLSRIFWALQNLWQTPEHCRQASKRYTSFSHPREPPGAPS